MALRNDGEINAEEFAPGFKLKPYIKRIFDVSAATVGLVLFAPVLFVVSVAIAVEFDRSNLNPRDPVRIQGADPSLQI